MLGGRERVCWADEIFQIWWRLRDVLWASGGSTIVFCVVQGFVLSRLAVVEQETL
jgi:hypothetical protein